METLIALVGIVALIAILLFYGSLSWGFVISKFYLWFIVSTIPDAPNFTVLQFIGIAFFLSAIMPKHTVVQIKKEYKDENQSLIISLIGPWITLLCGYILYCFY